MSVDDSQPWLPTSRPPAEADLIRWGSGADTYSLPDAVCVRQRENFAETTHVTQEMHLVFARSRALGSEGLFCEEACG